MKAHAFFLAATLLISATGASAQVSIPLLDKVPGHRVTFGYTYSLSKDGKPSFEVTDGTVTVEGNAYRLSGLEIEIYSDGTTRWSVDPAAKEVLVETVEEDDIITNPALLISSYRDYSSQLKVLRQTADALDIQVTFDEATVAVFRLRDVRLSDPAGDKKDFTFDVKSLDKSYVVTDLR